MPKKKRKKTGQSRKVWSYHKLRDSWLEGKSSINESHFFTQTSATVDIYPQGTPCW